MKDETAKSLWTRNPRRHFNRDVDVFSSAPSSPCGKWLGGMALALWLCVKGARFIATSKAVWYGRHGTSLALDGTDAILLGILFVCAGVFCHFHYFWGNTERLAYYHHAGKVISLVIFIGTMGTLFWRLFSNLV